MNRTKPRGYPWTTQTKAIMKMLYPLLFLACALPAAAQVSQPTGPATSVTANGSVKVPAGAHHKTASGLEVWSDDNTKGHATVLSSGDEDTVTTSKGWVGDIDGMQAGDSVALGNRVDTWVTGTGGDISFSTGSLLVTNFADLGGDDINVTDGKGVLHTVGPGDTRAF